MYLMVNQGPIGMVSMLYIRAMLTLCHLDRVRATFTTFSSSIHPQFLNSVDGEIPPGIFPPIYHTTGTTFTPYLTEHELERIDSTIMQSKRWKVPPPSVREAVVARQPRPKPIHSTWLCGKSAPESCGNCGQASSTKMPQCSM